MFWSNEWSFYGIGKLDGPIDLLPMVVHSTFVY